MNFIHSLYAKNKSEKKRNAKILEFENSMLIINPIVILQNSYYIELYNKTLINNKILTILQYKKFHILFHIFTRISIYRF